MNINERTRTLFMFVYLTKQKKFLVRVLINEQTNELPAELFTNYSMNVRFVCSPKSPASESW
ncbi:hypothetical protein Hanom_Chr01g00091131 [Helianthus anomalus]